MAATPSGKDKILRWCRIYLGGYDLSGDARTLGNLQNEFDESDFTAWNEAARTYLAHRHVISARGFQALINDDSGRSLEQMQTAPAASRLSIVFGGAGEPAIPDPAFLMPSVELGNSISFDNGAGLIQADFLPDTTQIDSDVGNPMGVLLQPATSISTTTTNSSHDNEAASTNGWHANLHVLATSSGDYAFVIEHSTDDGSFSTLGTFTADGSAITSEYLSGSGTVNRYVRVVSTRTAGTVTAVVTFARG